ncbi:hypothetical protein [Campylobacter fetus]|uniref:hypothetical protein n=1 Tax=Campylobacter fetus TaxID=196 RepID=UPI000FCCB17A|nr:hypothetical protein [Campylobacter fetus]QQF52881.1 hypothetical protein HHI31_08610 [Campylobacter fetus subsp. venerealis]RUT49943.1 hypothetical protein BWK67_06275 [Campylobacter fetus]RUT50204.1 hypothetical protein BWK51_06255 [Campylobacter fetus]
MQVVVREIKIAHQMCEIKFSSQVGELFMLGLELQDDIKIGSKVLLGFKNSDIALSSHKQISTRNNFCVSITNISVGEIISTINLNSNGFIFETVLSSNLINEFKIGEEIWACLNETSLYISEIL